MKLKTMGPRVRPVWRSRRRRSVRDTSARRAQPEAGQRVWSLLLPPGYPPDPR